MRAALIVGPHRVRIEDVPLPAPKPTEVRIRVEGCGVCASNLGPWDGLPWIRYPLAPGNPGHEAWGTIDCVGEAVTSCRRDDRVAILSAHGYAEFDIARADQVVPLPRFLDGQAFPGEALGCAMNIFRRAEIRRGDTVAIVGIGFLGAALTRLSKHAGARVIAISRRPYARELGKRCGADAVLDSSDPGAVAASVAEITGELGCERVIEAAGKQETLDLATQLTQEHGRLIIAGYHQDGPRMVNMQLWNWRGLDVINAHERNPAVVVGGIRAAITAVEEKVLDPRLLLTHSFSLEQLGEALAATAARPDGFLKATVTL
ncbi:MAG TPA: zinc-binding dehydrogenase [Terriglobales bacterium]|nr:zinc-binding dehydrogenase [Terriglobales bacterium]